MKLNKWNSCILGDVVKYAHSRISVDKLSAENYISTENMLPNRGGIVLASSLPTGNAVKYYKGQTLVSNIRPYFKKIWHAKNDGGCSADVLVFEIINDVDDKFFYYYLSQENFFEYVMAGSKGTKMPRGDKQQILMYPFSYPSKKEQKAIAATLSCLDDKIELNNRMNKNLEEMAQTIFKSWFVDFEPFQEGEFEESELGMIPKGWRVGTIGEIASISSGKRPPLKQDCSSAEIYIPVVGASSIMAYTSEYLFNEKILITGRVGTHGIIQRFSTPCWPSDNTLVIKSEYYEFVYQTLNGVDYKSMNRGSTQPLITQTDLKNINIIIPIESVLNGFEKLTLDIMTIWYENINQNKILSQLRDTLLPKLMSGEIRVPIEEVQ